MFTAAWRLTTLVAVSTACRAASSCALALFAVMPSSDSAVSASTVQRAGAISTTPSSTAKRVGVGDSGLKVIIPALSVETNGALPYKTGSRIITESDN